MIDFFAAVLVAALAGMGIGGGGLLVIFLILVRHMDAQTAQGVNLLFFIVSALTALPVHIFIKKRKIRFPLVAFIVLCALPGAFLGSFLASFLSGDAARKIFGWFLIVSGLLSVYKLLAARKKTRLDETAKPCYNEEKSNSERN